MKLTKPAQAMELRSLSSVFGGHLLFLCMERRTMKQLWHFPGLGSAGLGSLLRAVSVIAAVGLLGCELARKPGLQAGADALSRAAEDCLVDVRDRRLTFEASRHCSALSALSKSYIHEGGFQENVPAKIGLVAEQARTMAWMARAISNCRDCARSIW